jgi:hypothetical protein
MIYPKIRKGDPAAEAKAVFDRDVKICVASVFSQPFSKFHLRFDFDSDGNAMIVIEETWSSVKPYKHQEILFPPAEEMRHVGWWLERWHDNQQLNQRADEELAG